MKCVTYAQPIPQPLRREDTKTDELEIVQRKLCERNVLKRI